MNPPSIKKDALKALLRQIAQYQNDQQECGLLKTFTPVDLIYSHFYRNTLNSLKENDKKPYKDFDLAQRNRSSLTQMLGSLIVLSDAPIKLQQYHLNAFSQANNDERNNALQEYEKNGGVQIIERLMRHGLVIRTPDSQYQLNESLHQLAETPVEDVKRMLREIDSDDTFLSHTTGAGKDIRPHIIEYEKHIPTSHDASAPKQQDQLFREQPQMDAAHISQRQLEEITHLKELHFAKERAKRERDNQYDRGI